MEGTTQLPLHVTFELMLWFRMRANPAKLTAAQQLLIHIKWTASQQTVNFDVKKLKKKTNSPVDNLNQLY